MNNKIPAGKLFAYFLAGVALLPVAAGQGQLQLVDADGVVRASAAKFGARYATFGFNDVARLLGLH